MLFIIFLLLDQLIKYYIFINKPYLNLIPNWLEITYTENTGTIFGIAQGTNIIFAIVAIIIIFIKIYIILKTTKKNSYKRNIWQLILAGGVSNLIDRIFRGFVIDYVSLKFFGVCNLADFLIVAGVILLAIEELKDNAGGDVHIDPEK